MSVPAFLASQILILLTNSAAVISARKAIFPHNFLLVYKERRGHSQKLSCQCVHERESERINMLLPIEKYIT
jgi:hypothetical protein